MGMFVSKSGQKIEATQFLMHSPCQGATKYCNNYIVKSPIGLQQVRNYDYVLRTPNGGYFVMPKDLFELLMEPFNG